MDTDFSTPNSMSSLKNAKIWRIKGELLRDGIAINLTAIIF